MRRIKRCKDLDCPLSQLKEVAYEGEGKPQVIIVGESPGKEEVFEGRPFVGRAGKLMRRVAMKTGLPVGKALITNAARCRINKKSMTTKEITETLKHCRVNLVRAIEFCKPKLILILGDYALRQIMKRSGITKNQGKWQWSMEFECWTLSTFHPAYILRNMAMEPVLAQDFKQAAEFIHRGFEMAEMEETSYTEVESIMPVLDMKVGMRNNGCLSVGFDTETQGLDWTDPNFLMLSYQVSFRRGEAWMVRFYKEVEEEEEPDFFIQWMRAPEGKKKKELVDVGIKVCGDIELKLHELQMLIESERIKKYMSHGNFDLHAVDATFRRLRQRMPKWSNYAMDVQAGAHLLEENVYQMASLDSLQRGFSDVKADYNREFEMQYDKSDMLKVPGEDLVHYGCTDSDVTRRVAARIKHELVKEKRLANYMVKLVMPTLTKSLFELERNGAHIDQEQLPKTTKAVVKMKDAAEKAALKKVTQQIRDRHTKAGLKLTRRDLVADALFDDDGFALDPVKKSKGGEKWSTDKEVRKTLLDRRIPKRAKVFIEKFNEFSEYHTLWSRYLRGFGKHVKSDGRIHSDLSLTRAVTGRVSSSNPNMMNNPKRSTSAGLVRKLIAAPKGYLLLAADEEQSELRWAAHLSGDPAMMKVFAEDGDIHKATALELISSPWEEMNEHEQWGARRNAKVVNFGVLFLMTPIGFVRYAKMDYGIVLSEEEAEEWIQLFFRKYARLPIYHKRMIEFCREFGYVESPLGRRRHLPEINAQNKMIRREAERMAVNQPIQSPSSDVVLMAGNEIIDKDIDPEEFKMVMFIHDELVFQVKDNSKVEDYARLVKYEMENPQLERDFGFKMRVPLRAGVKVGKNAAEMKELEL